MSGDILGLYFLGRMLQHPETVEKVARVGVFRGVQIFEGLLSLERIYVLPGLFYKRITPNSNLGTVSSDFQEVVKIWQKRFA